MYTHHMQTHTLMYVHTHIHACAHTHTIALMQDGGDRYYVETLTTLCYDPGL